jgi:hypothetical protein
MTERRSIPRGEECKLCGAKPPAQCDDAIHRVKRWSPDEPSNPIEDIKREIDRLKSMVPRKPPSPFLERLFIAQYSRDPKLCAEMMREMTVDRGRLMLACSKHWRSLPEIFSFWFMAPGEAICELRVGTMEAGRMQTWRTRSGP